jgi:hypothetical protein
LSGTIDLRNASHIREVLADGTSVTQIKLPSASPLETLKYADTNQYIILNKQQKLTTLEYEGCKANITTFAVTDCPNVDAVGMLVDILETQTSQGVSNIAGVRLQGINKVSDSSAILETLATLAESEQFFGVDVDGNPIEGSRPILTGKIVVNGYAYEDSVNALRAVFPDLEIEVSGYYIRFEDAEVLRVLLSKGVGDGVGITYEQAEKALSNGINQNYFKGNTTIRKFNELRYFTSCKSLTHHSFDGCTALEEIDLSNITQIRDCEFLNCTSLKKIGSLKNVTYLGSRVFELCSSLEIELNLPNLTSLGTAYGHFRYSGITKIVSLGSITNIPRSTGKGEFGAFAYCKNLTEVNLPSTCTEVEGAFCGCTNLKTINTEHLVKIGAYTFQDCESLESVDIRNALYIGDSGFYHCYKLKNINPYNVEYIGGAAFSSSLFSKLELRNLKNINSEKTSSSSNFYMCDNLTKIYLPLIEYISVNTFYGPGCVDNKKIVLGQNLNKLENSFNFTNVTKTDFYIQATTPPTLTSSPTIRTNQDIKFHIPIGTLSAYQNATNWSNISNAFVEYDFDTDPDNVLNYD